MLYKNKSGFFKDNYFIENRGCSGGLMSATFNSVDNFRKKKFLSKPNEFFFSQFQVCLSLRSRQKQYFYSQSDPRSSFSYCHGRYDGGHTSS